MVDWQVSAGLTPYPEALAAMEARVASILDGTKREQIWLLEHPALYTKGSSGAAGDLLVPTRFPVFETGRGGAFTYHGPGQRVAYVMLNLNRRGRDLRAFVQQLERWLILTLAQFSLHAFVRAGRIGVWVQHPSRGECKIAAIGVRVRRWVSFHGVALNVEPDLEHFSGIVPCGIRDFGVTSLVDLGLPVSLADVDLALKQSFAQVFTTAAPGERFI